MKKIFFNILFLFGFLVCDNIHYNISHSAFYSEKGVIKDAKYLGLTDSYELAFFKYKNLLDVYALSPKHIDKVFIINDNDSYYLHDMNAKIYDGVVKKYTLINSFSDLQKLDIDTSKADDTNFITRRAPELQKSFKSLSPWMFLIAGIANFAMKNTNDVDNMEKLYDAQSVSLTLGAIFLWFDLKTLSTN
tara:strand:- start:2481 stop:3050 length:570 start_codon:yes stop_codon:yes gene_type:complete